MAERPCGFRLCVSLAAEGHEYCVIHNPEALLERVKKILASNINQAASGRTFEDRVKLIALERSFLAELERTT